MSVREARLCDTNGCNNPAQSACALCMLDRCTEHFGDQYIAIAVISGRGGAPVINEFLGKCPAVSVCVACRITINVYSVGVHIDASKMPLSGLVAPMRDKLIEAAGAFLAENALHKSR